MSSPSRVFLLPGLACFVLAACGGSVEQVPDPTGGASGASSGSNAAGAGGGGSRSSTGGVGGATCTMAPACNAGDAAHATQETACQEITGMSCYARSACGTTIWCSHFEDAQCDGLPACDPGWSEVKGCVPDSQCEKKTVCGVSIICQKIDPTCEGVQPICDPGDEEIAGSLECGPPNMRCYTRSNSCGFTIWCRGPA